MNQTYMNVINSLVDTVRYGVVSGDSQYQVAPNSEQKFFFNQVKTEKGIITKSPYGNFDSELSYVLVQRDSDSNYTYKVQVKDSDDYVILLTNVTNLTTSSLKKAGAEELAQLQGGGTNESASIFNSTTGTGTIYRYLNGSQFLGLNIGESIENHMNDEIYGISIDPCSFNSINYLKHEVEGWRIKASYVCFIADNREHCLRGGGAVAEWDDEMGEPVVKTPSIYYSANASVLQEVQGWFNVNGTSCNINNSASSSNCYGTTLYNIVVNNSGYVGVSSSGITCDVDFDDFSTCYHS